MMDAEKSRLEQFKEFVELDPSDTFSRYALGMEYMGTAEYPAALQQFEEVIRLEPAEPAAYSQAAIAAENLNQIDQARILLQKGIEVATKKGDKHTREEMEAALEKLDDK
jgi:Tfp pilus assembly protein PilF